MDKFARVDLIWDDYTDKSLKESARLKRGEGFRRRVIPTTPIPTNWSGFLRSNENKKELFAFLSNECRKINADDSELIVTLKENVACSKEIDTSSLELCFHEDADTRMMVHLADAYQRDHHTSIMLRAVDTDVVVLSIQVAAKLQVPEVWVTFGTGKNQRKLAIHKYVKVFGEQKSLTLPLFHALTGQ